MGIEIILKIPFNMQINSTFTLTKAFSNLYNYVNMPPKIVRGVDFVQHIWYFM